MEVTDEEQGVKVPARYSGQNEGAEGGEEQTARTPRAKNTPYAGKVSDGKYNIKKKSQCTTEAQGQQKAKNPYNKEQAEKARLRARRSNDPTFIGRKHNYDKHRERIRDVEPVVDCHCPLTFKNPYVSQTKFNRSLASFSQMERNNAMLLHRISVIMEGQPTISNRLRVNTRDIGAKGRCREMSLLRITFENIHMLQRIQKSQPVYSRSKQLKDYARNEYAMGKLSYYPLFWKVKQPSGNEEFESIAYANAENNPRPTVFFDLETKLPSGKWESEGRVAIELRADVVPLTAENFRSLCTGEYGPSYKCTQIHRVIQNLFIQGGDITSKGGLAPVSGFGQSFPNENFKLKHSEAGVVTMVNYGDGNSACQFMITGKKMACFDGQNVVVGRVISGMDIVKKLLENVNSSNKPKNPIFITDCGQCECVEVREIECEDVEVECEEDEDCEDDVEPTKSSGGKAKNSVGKKSTEGESGADSTYANPTSNPPSHPTTPSQLPSGPDDFYDSGPEDA